MKVGASAKKYFASDDISEKILKALYQYGKRK